MLLILAIINIILMLILVFLPCLKEKIPIISKMIKIYRWIQAEKKKLQADSACSKETLELHFKPNGNFDEELIKAHFNSASENISMNETVKLD